MEQYVKYLRKSRFDRDYAELSIEETLKRHEDIILRKHIMRLYRANLLPQDLKFKKCLKRLVPEYMPAYWLLTLNVWQEVMVLTRHISVRYFSFPEQKL